MYGGQATQEMRYPSCGGSSTSAFPKGKQLGCFSSFLDITRSEFLKTAQKSRKERLLLLFMTLCHVVYATIGFI